MPTSFLNTLSTGYMIGKSLVSWRAFTIKKNRPIEVGTSEKAYRPSQWEPPISLNESTRTSLLSKVGTNISGKVKIAAVGTNLVGTTSQQEKTVALFFDGFVREDHNSSLRITDHPVQSGANISDHAYKLPEQVTVEIIVSDSMDSVVTNQFTEYGVKSISAYKALKELQDSRQPLSINTKYGTYNNMLIESLSSPVDYKSTNKMICTASLKRILIARVATELTVSAIPHANKESNKGKVLPENGDIFLEQYRASQTSAAVQIGL